jgi:hypothetical protein
MHGSTLEWFIRHILEHPAMVFKFRTDQSTREYKHPQPQNKQDIETKAISINMFLRFF